MSLLSEIGEICGSSERLEKCVGFLFERNGRGFSAHAMAIQTGLSFEDALVAAMLLSRRKKASRLWSIYHECSEHRVSSRPFSEGFQPVPWRCPDCQREVIDPNALTYELNFLLTGDFNYAD